MSKKYDLRKEIDSVYYNTEYTLNTADIEYIDYITVIYPSFIYSLIIFISGMHSFLTGVLTLIILIAVSADYYEDDNLHNKIIRHALDFIKKYSNDEYRIIHYTGECKLDDFCKDNINIYKLVKNNSDLYKKRDDKITIALNKSIKKAKFFKGIALFMTSFNIIASIYLMQSKPVTILERETVGLMIFFICSLFFFWYRDYLRGKHSDLRKNEI